MRPVSTILLSLLILCTAANVKSQDIRLLYNMQQGESYLLEVDIQQGTRSESIEAEEISLSSHSLLLFRVDSTEDDDLLHLTVNYRELQLSMIAPGLDIAFNSGDRSNPTLIAMLDSLEAGSFRIIIDRRGQLRSLDGLKAIFASLSSMPLSETSGQLVVLRTLEELYGPDSFRSLAGLFITVYPVLPSMTNWTNDITYYFNTKAVQMVSRYGLTRSTDDYHVIQGLGMLNSTEAFVEETGMGEVESTVAGSQTYDFQMDRNTGWLNRCVSRQRVRIETTILNSPSLPTGLKIPSYTDTLFEVYGSRVQNDL